MNLQDFWRTIAQRWWVILATVALALAGALIYAHHEQRIYQASATMIAHPSLKVNKAIDVNTDIGLLTYGTLGQTFASLAESRTLLNEAGRALGATQATLNQYTAKSETLPGTAVLKVSVAGPDASLSARLANAVITRAGRATNEYFRVITLTPLDPATIPDTLIRPQPARDALYAVLAALLAGYAIATLTLQSLAPSAPMAPLTEVSVNGRRPAEFDNAEHTHAGAWSRSVGE
jgi:capsular polysaccharide biosynthesis protein